MSELLHHNFEVGKLYTWNQKADGRWIAAVFGSPFSSEHAVLLGTLPVNEEFMFLSESWTPKGRWLEILICSQTPIIGFALFYSEDTFSYVHHDS